MQVAGAMLDAMGAGPGPWAVHTQPSSVRTFRCWSIARELLTPTSLQIDSLVPAYSCPAADAVRDAFQDVPAWTTHLSDNAPLKARLDAVFGTAGLDAWSSWCLYPIPFHLLTLLVSCFFFR